MTILNWTLLQTLNLAQTNSPSHCGLLVWGGVFKDLIDSLRVTENAFCEKSLKMQTINLFSLYFDSKILPLRFQSRQGRFAKHGNRGNDRQPLILHKKRLKQKLQTTLSKQTVFNNSREYLWNSQFAITFRLISQILSHWKLFLKLSYLSTL